MTRPVAVHPARSRERRRHTPSSQHFTIDQIKIGNRGSIVICHRLSRRLRASCFALHASQCSSLQKCRNDLLSHWQCSLNAGHPTSPTSASNALEACVTQELRRCGPYTVFVRQRIYHRSEMTVLLSQSIGPSLLGLEVTSI